MPRFGAFHEALTIPDEIQTAPPDWESIEPAYVQGDWCLSSRGAWHGDTNGVGHFLGLAALCIKVNDASRPGPQAAKSSKAK